MESHDFLAAGEVCNELYSDPSQAIQKKKKKLSQPWTDMNADHKSASAIPHREGKREKETDRARDREPDRASARDRESVRDSSRDRQGECESQTEGEKETDRQRQIESVRERQSARDRNGES